MARSPPDDSSDDSSSLMRPQKIARTAPTPVCLMRPPKPLKKQAADRLALFILKASWPSVVAAVDYDLDDQDYYYKGAMTRRLRQIKNWYWLETEDYLGDTLSKLRSVVSTSFMDVMDWKNAFKRASCIQRFVVQITFCVDVGILEKTSENVVGGGMCSVMMQLFATLHEMYFSCLFNSNLSYCDPTVIVAMFEYTENLRKIHLHLNFAYAALYFLQVMTSQLEVLVFDVNNQYLNDSEGLDNDIYKAFFRDLTKAEAEARMKAGQSLEASFNKLKEVVIRCDRFSASLFDFTICLHNCYPKTRIVNTCLAALPHAYGVPRAPFITPTLIVHKSDNCKRVGIFLKDANLLEFPVEFADAAGQPDAIPKIIKAFCRSVSQFQRGMLSIIEGGPPFYYFFYERLQVFMRIEIKEDSSKHLGELYVLGCVRRLQDEVHLARTLNRCSNLRALSIQVKIEKTPTIVMNLQRMTNLRILRVKFCEEFPTGSLPLYPPLPPQPPQNEEQEENLRVRTNRKKQFLSQLLMAAPNLIYLEIPGNCGLDELIELDVFSGLQTLSITNGSIATLLPCLKQLPNISKLVLTETFGYAKYLRIKKLYKCSDLMVVYKKERSVAPFF